MPLEELVYATVHDELVYTTILFGPEINFNNGMVYDCLQLLTLNGTARPWINIYKRSRNCRATWKALMAYYEADSMRT